MRLSASPDASAADIKRCEAYLGQVLQKFPNEYSSAFVTDAAGHGALLQRADRRRHGLLRPRDLPAGARDPQVHRQRPARQPRHAQRGDPDGAADPARRRVPRHVRPRNLAALVRRSRDAGIGRRPDRRVAGRSARQLARRQSPRRRASCRSPCGSPPRSSAARQAFRDYGQDGQLYDFRLLPLADTSIFVGRGARRSSRVSPRCWPTGAASSWSCWRSAAALAGGLARRRPLVRAAAALHPRLRRSRGARRRHEARAQAPLGSGAGIGRRGRPRDGRGDRQPRGRAAGPASSSATTCCARSITG